MNNLYNTWYKNILKNKLQKLKKIEITSYNLPLIEETLKVIKDFETTLIFTRDNFSASKILESDYLFLNPYQFLYSTIKKIANIPNEEFLKNAKIPTLNISNKELLTLTHDFFKQCTSPQIFNDFEHFFKRKNTNIHFENNPNCPYADTIYLPYYQEGYMQISPKHEFLDIATLAHEFGHLIQFKNNYKHTLFNELKPFSEITSSFFELICAEYYTTHGFEEIGIITQFEELDKTLESAKSIFLELELLELIKIDYYQNKNDLRNNITNLLEQDTEEIELLLSEEPSSYFIYTIGWLISCNLFIIYKSAPEKAFYLLYKIINIDLEINAKCYFQELDKLNLTTISGITKYNDYIKRKLTKI